MIRSFLSLALCSACVVTTGFDRYDTTPIKKLYRVSGTVNGLDGEPIALRLNGRKTITVATDGAFSFPAVLEDGVAYEITVPYEPSRITCSISGGAGTIRSEDASGVAVQCLSNEATLGDLKLSAGLLYPAFWPLTPSYTVDAQIKTSAIPSLAGSTTVTATAKRAGARIRINGSDAISGKPTPIGFKSGSTPIKVEVTAPDGHSSSYAVTVSGLPNPSDYIKASSTSVGATFGRSVAIDGDTLVVGAAFELGTGAVYVFRRKGTMWSEEARLTASNARQQSWFGASVDLSGNTLVVGSPQESSAATGIDGDQSNTSASRAGAAYVFVRTGTTWTQQAYVKASNTRVNARFGTSVAISGDTIVAGSPWESSAATGIDGNQGDTSMTQAGAGYVLTRSGTTWTQQAYIKSSTTQPGAFFGEAVDIDGDMIVIGSYGESSFEGAAYVFTRASSKWSVQTRLNASNARPNARFGNCVAISSDTIAVGSPRESSAATGIDGDQNDTSQDLAGAAYVFARANSMWSQQAYVKASNTPAGLSFGSSVALSGSTLVVGSIGETSKATGIDGDQSPATLTNAGAAYAFSRTGAKWSQEAYVKASNTRALSSFGFSVAVSSDTLAVGSPNESSGATGINGDQSDTSTSSAGAVYVF